MKLPEALLTGEEVDEGDFVLADSCLLQLINTHEDAAACCKHGV